MTFGFRITAVAAALAGAACAVPALAAGHALKPPRSSTALTPAAPNSVHPAARVEAVYALGVAAYAPAAAVVRLDGTFRTVDNLSPQRMLALAAETRADELSGYKAALADLERLHAPAPITLPYSTAVARLRLPLAITDGAKVELPGDPAGQQVWSTLDEADALAPPEDGQLPVWLKLTHGLDSLWAFRVGNVMAVAQADIPGRPSDWPLMPGAASLGTEAPPTTPQQLIDALVKTGELARHHHLLPGDVQSLVDTTRDLFGDPSQLK